MPAPLMFQIVPVNISASDSFEDHLLLFTAESRTCCAITGHNLWLEMGFAHRRRRFLMAKPVTITAQKAVNSNDQASECAG